MGCGPDLGRELITPGVMGASALSHNRRQLLDIRHSRTALFGLHLGDGVELPVHLGNLSISFSLSL